MRGEILQELEGKEGGKNLCQYNTHMKFSRTKKENNDSLTCATFLVSLLASSQVTVTTSLEHLTFKLT